VFSIFFMFRRLTSTELSETRRNNRTCECFELGVNPPAMAIAAAVVVSARRDEVGLLEVLQVHCDHRLIQDRRVGLLKPVPEFGSGLPLSVEISNFLQGNIPIRLDGHCLVELRAEWKYQIESIAWSQTIPGPTLFKRRRAANSGLLLGVR